MQMLVDHVTLELSHHRHASLTPVRHLHKLDICAECAGRSLHSSSKLMISCEGEECTQTPARAKTCVPVSCPLRASLAPPRHAISDFQYERVTGHPVCLLSGYELPAHYATYCLQRLYRELAYTASPTVDPAEWKADADLQGYMCRPPRCMAMPVVFMGSHAGQHGAAYRPTQGLLTTLLLCAYASLL